MKKSILFLMGLLMGLTSAFAQGFPTISTDENTKWYLIQFSNGGDALTANTSGTQITIGAALGSNAQLWKITGNSTDGYTFTNKKGYTLYVNSAATNQMVNAATSPSGVSKPCDYCPYVHICLKNSNDSYFLLSHILNI